MRQKTVIFLLFAAVVFMVAGNAVRQQMSSRLRNMTALSADSLASDTAVADTAEAKQQPATADTLSLDSLRRAIMEHNRIVDDSIRRDSIQRSKANGIEAPVVFSAEDSLIYDGKSKTAFLFGKSKVDYQNMKLASDKVAMSLDSSLVRASGSPDSTAENGLKGTPVFSMGKDKYESDTIAFNFKTKKGLINNVYTEQEDGFLRGEKAKRNDQGTVYIQHGRYTTCDLEHPDFYIALSRAKVRPGKDVVFDLRRREPARLLSARRRLLLRHQRQVGPEASGRNLHQRLVGCVGSIELQEALQILWKLPLQLPENH